MDNEKFRNGAKKLGLFINDVLAIVYSNDPQATLFFNGHGRNPQTVWEQMVTKLYANAIYSEGHESRLNNAGLKLFWRSGPDDGISAYINGDQRNDHRGAYLVMTMLLNKYGFLSKDRLDGTIEPMANWWMDENWEIIEPWAWHWVREHPELLPETVQ